MSCVVDASVFVAAVIDDGPSGVWAEEVLSEGDIATPDLALVESASILRRLERSRRVSTADASAAYQFLAQLDLHLVPFEPFARRVWALRENFTAYDAWSVAVAEGLGLPLATLDRRMVGGAGARRAFRVPG
jgi:predicted nucleic acid-binding protein